MKKKLTIILFWTLIYTNTYAQNSQTNFIVFLADDVSWNDFGCYGNSDVQTPNIDKLASEGLMFSNFYLTASSCSPSRNSILTGRYPHNTGAAELHTEPPLAMISFPEVLRNTNYYSAQAGKFHMGHYARRGFDVTSEDSKLNGDGGEHMWLKSIKERPKDQPFFMWFASYDAHREWGPNEFSGSHAPDEINPPFYLANGKETKSDLAKYYDEIKRFDFYIGIVIEELESQNILDNTMIIVMADNGRPFPHSKTRVNDRGMKSPFILHWPQAVKNKGGVCHSLVSAVDIAPTIMKIAKAKYSNTFQGYSFDSLIAKPDTKFRNFVFAEHNWHDYQAHERMVRNRDFMYILNSRPSMAQSGPADAVGSPSYKELDILKNNGSLTTIQADIFAVPRANEELYDLKRDALQLLNVGAVPKYKENLTFMRNVLTEWMQETGDNIPENLTNDWYLKEPGYLKTQFYKIRGEMPGERLNATHNHNKGRF